MKHLINMNTRNCRVCGQSTHGRITTQCPKGKLCDDIAKRVQSGQIDFVDGSWVSLKPIQEEAKPEVTVADSLSSLFEFMEAMVPELSPETSDELTDQDIGMLKSISLVPLPVRHVSRLQLPVSVLVTLHKLNRLEYVCFNGLSSSYVITDKGITILEPKPVTLNAEQTVLLLSIATDDEPWTMHDLTELRMHEEMQYIYELGLVHIKNRVYVLTEAGLNHVNKILALTV